MSARPLEIVQLEVGLLQNFCEVSGCPETGVAALVDPALVEVARAVASAPQVEVVAEGNFVQVGAGCVGAIWSPGHTPGSVCGYTPEADTLEALCAYKDIAVPRS